MVLVFVVLAAVVPDVAYFLVGLWTGTPPPGATSRRPSEEEVSKPVKDLCRKL